MASPVPVELPGNVSIYDGPNGEALLEAKVFTRLVTTAPDEDKLADALSGGDFEGFCHQHDKSVLIFDSDLETHHEHFRQVCLRLKDNGDIGVEYAACVFDAGEALGAGFQMDKLESGAVSKLQGFSNRVSCELTVAFLVVIDLRDDAEEDDSSDDSDMADA